MLMLKVQIVKTGFKSKKKKKKRFSEEYFCSSLNEKKGKNVISSLLTLIMLFRFEILLP